MWRHIYITSYHQRYLAHYKGILASAGSGSVDSGGAAIATSITNGDNAVAGGEASAGGGGGGGGGAAATEEEGVKYQTRSNLMYIQHTTGHTVGCDGNTCKCKGL